MHRLKVTLLVSFVIAIFISLFGTCYKNFYRLPNNYNTEYITMKLLHIELELSSNNEGPININNFFTTSENKHFSETYSFSITSILTEDFHKLQYDVPLPDTLINLRFDLGSMPGKFALKNLYIGNRPINILQKDAISLSDDLKIVKITDDCVFFESIGEDPYFVINHNFIDDNLSYNEVLKISKFHRLFRKYVYRFNDYVLIYSLSLFIAFISFVYRKKVFIPVLCLIFFIILCYYQIMNKDATDNFRGDTLNALYKIFHSEYPVTMIVISFGAASFCLKKWYWKLLTSLPGLITIALICADIFTYSQFKTHIIISDIFNFYKDGLDSIHIVIHFIKRNWFIVINLIIALCLFIFISCVAKSDKKGRYQIILTTLLLSAGLYLLPEPQSTLWDSMFDNILRGGRASINAEKRYSENYKYNNYEPTIHTLNGLSLRKNVIVVMTESLSADESELLKGSYNNLPNLDKLARENMYFSDYYSEGYNTDTGNFAFLTSLPYIHDGKLLSDRYYSNSITKRFSEYGYITNLFYSAHPIGSLNNIYNKLNFTNQFDSNDSFYDNSERLTFDSVPDGDLFDYVISKIDYLAGGEQPSFSLIMTTTTHSPYIVPKTHEKNFHKTIRYVDQAIYDFYLKLKEHRYFDNGILIITGDHRAMIPYRIQERNKYGNFGIARVPLIIIGLENNLGITDVPFSHSSLSGLLQYINLPVVKMYDFNQLPVRQNNSLTESKPILYQVHEPADLVFVLWNDKQYTVHLDGDDTYIEDSSDQNILDQILKQITWLRK